MRLDEVWQGAPPVEVAGLAYDSRQVRPGDAFFCVRGFTRDGHDLAPGAVAAGAGALVVDHPLGLGVPEVVVDDVRAAMAPAAARLHGDPTAALRVVGITGTNGKTTTAYLVCALLAGAGHPTGLLGTVTSVVGGQEAPAVRTTPEAIDLQGTFARMVAAGDSHVDHRDAGPGGEQTALGREVGLHVGVEPQVGLREVGEHRHRPVDRVGTVQLQGVGGDLHDAGR